MQENEKKYTECRNIKINYINFVCSLSTERNFMEKGIRSFSYPKIPISGHISFRSVRGSRKSKHGRNFEREDFRKLEELEEIATGNVSFQPICSPRTTDGHDTLTHPRVSKLSFPSFLFSNTRSLRPRHTARCNDNTSR